MKKIQLLLTLLLCMVFASANAQQNWNFASMSQADKDLCVADANWVLGTDRYCYTKELTEAALVAVLCKGTEVYCQRTKRQYRG